MVAAYHLIWSAYACWLPNDPRGSSSQTIRNDILRDLGELHFGRKRLQPAGRDIRAFYDRADDLLKHERLVFPPEEIPLIANSFAEVIERERYTCYACAVMPDHVHLLIRKHRDRGETMIEKLQYASRNTLIATGRRAVTHPTWGGKGWIVFQDTREDIERTIRYILNNPLKIGLPAQHWSFVKPYDGWLPGHAPWKK